MEKKIWGYEKKIETRKKKSRGIYFFFWRSFRKKNQKLKKKSGGIKFFLGAIPNFRQKFEKYGGMKAKCPHK